MGIKVKAIERNVAFEKGKQKWAFVMQADLYSQLNASTYFFSCYRGLL